MFNYVDSCVFSWIHTSPGKNNPLPAGKQLCDLRFDPLKVYLFKALDQVDLGSGWNLVTFPNEGWWFSMVFLVCLPENCIKKAFTCHHLPIKMVIFHSYASYVKWPIWVNFLAPASLRLGNHPKMAQEFRCFSVLSCWEKAEKISGLEKKGVCDIFKMPQTNQHIRT